MFSCKEEDFPVFALFTEDPLYVSGEQAQLVGRLITNELLEVEDHGFWMDVDEDFSNPEIISLGIRSAPGRFIGQVDGLLPGKTYFAKTFTIFRGVTSFGNVIQINSLIPGIFSFNPDYALPGQKMEITGLNLGADTKVFFDDYEAFIEEIIYESILVLIIPPIQNNPSPIIKVVSNGVEMKFENRFEYMVGKMNFIGFPEKYRLVNSLSFSAKNKFYVGFGYDLQLNINRFFWEFDPVQGIWNRLDFDIQPHILGFGAEGYFGGGYDAVDVYNTALPNNLFWYWNGNELVRKADVPFPAINSLCFQIKGKIYVLGGSSQEHRNTLFRYDPSIDNWSRLSDFPFAIEANLPYFVHQDYLYFISDRKELIMFDPETGQRQTVSTYPGSIINQFGVAVVLEDRAIIGFYRQEVEIWELDLSNLSWKRKINFSGVFLGNNLGIYSHNNLVYLLRSTNLPIPQFGQMEFWEFDPDGF